MSHLRTETSDEITTEIPVPPSPLSLFRNPRWQCAGCQNSYPEGQHCQLCITCDRCNTTVRAIHVVHTVTGSQICPACRGAHYWYCQGCDGWNPNDHPCINDCTDDPDDEDDDPDDDECDGSIHSYSYKPAPVFHGTGALFLGLELEVATPYEGRGRAADLAGRWLGSLGYLKADDSIDGGFEVVTHPMTYPWAIQNFPWPMLAALAEDGCRATTKTGLHVHLSRAGFAGPGHTYRWMKFIYRNQPAVTALARRDPTRWAAFHDADRRAVKDYAKGWRGDDRYRAINTLNRDTFELRIFASSLEPEQVQAALGLAAASVDYTRDLTITEIVRHNAWAWPAFTDWLTTRAEYAPLLAQVEALTCAC